MFTEAAIVAGVIFGLGYIANWVLWRLMVSNLGDHEKINVPWSKRVFFSMALIIPYGMIILGSALYVFAMARSVVVYFYNFIVRGFIE